MNGFGERTRLWSSDPGRSEAADEEAPSTKDFGTSMNAISFGFVATAILISMFLIMAIFEHLRRSPRTSFAQSADGGAGSLGGDRQQAQLHWLRKFNSPQSVVMTRNTSDLSVLMPGQQYPTYLAQPAPLPCPREGMHPDGAIKCKFMFQEIQRV